MVKAQSKEDTKQNKQITKKHPYNHDGDLRFQFNEEKFQEWCKQFNKNPNTQIKPKYLIKCDQCHKVYDNNQYKKHKYNHKIKKNKFIKINRIEQNYKCIVQNCQFSSTQNRKFFIDHLIFHSEQELLEMNIKPEDVFNENQLKQYKSSESIIQNKIKNSYFQISRQKLVERGRLWEAQTQSYQKLEIEQIKDNLRKQFIDKDKLQQLREQIFNESMIPEIKIIIEEAQSFNIFFEISSKKDLLLKEDKFNYVVYNFNQIRNNKQLLNNIWSEYKLLKYFSGVSTQFQNQLIGLSTDGDDLIFVTRKFNQTMKYLMENRADDEILYTQIMGLIDSIIELHSLDIVHRDIKPENVLINNNDNFEVFLANYNYSIKLGDNSKIKPNSRNKYINIQLQINNGSKFWDIYSLTLILLEFIIGKDQFKQLIEKKSQFKDKLEQCFGILNIKPEVQQLFKKVLIQENETVKIEELADMFQQFQ